MKLIFHHRPVRTATNRSLLAHRYNFVGNSSGNKEFLPEHPRHHPIALTSIISATMSFFNRIIGWRRSARLRVIAKLLSRRPLCRFHWSSEYWYFLYGFAMPLAAKYLHTSLFVCHFCNALSEF
ncbi:hypothetical protein DNB05_19220 [Shigella flexneri]|nr:hypothetical protein [Shigella flexneri]EFX8706828.1 hypothetical protein [Shigella flexneri]EFY1877549.1 hypothetical protein [Shigella flexneri]EFY2299225.1 hypothetical protein [Shigella flexneri]EFY2612051.1 hypothetical protein [Shigella flexneri]